jgi:hypothetical protein
MTTMTLQAEHADEVERLTAARADEAASAERRSQEAAEDAQDRERVLQVCVGVCLCVFVFVCVASRVQLQQSRSVVRCSNTACLCPSLPSPSVPSSPPRGHGR